MSRSWAECGVCDSLKVTKPSVVWCSECDEGLCSECDKHHAVSKASRTHSTILISDYEKLPSDILEITHNCQKHDELYQIYCRKHDCPCCRRCVIETHNDCKDITAVDDIIKDVKSSSALYDIELTLEEVAENLEKITKDRRDNLTSLKEQRRRIENEIQQTRIKVNSHLDQIQEDLMKELNTKEETESKKIENLLTSLEKKKKEINLHKTTFSNIKQHASEFQTYLFIKQMETKLNIEERFVENFANSDSLKWIALSLNMLKDDKDFKSISNFNMFKSFGEIEVEMRRSGVVMTRRQGKQAQMEFVSSSPRLIEDIKLNLKQTINTGLINTTGCLMLPNDRLVFSCRGNNLIKFFSSDGKKEFDIVSKSCNVMDLTLIPEDNTIVATSGGDGFHNISIIDIKQRKVSKNIKVNSSYYGIVYKNSQLITCARDKGLHILKNGSSDVFDDFTIKEISSFSYVTSFTNKVYYTNNSLHTVTCCDLKGTVLWTFKDKKVLQSPRGITVDNDGNIYVSSFDSFKVIVISSDGKRCLELLSAKDGLCNPSVLDYDRSTNQLLVANERDTALLFTVTTKTQKQMNTTGT